ncbi:primosomal protein N' [Clostridium oryzae]|uniref:Replication restart protein PriA n=1 Tax=Clostridium oryzae TaxID=1450648 RepID=A0A1V4IPL0_9CLOT|nr:primosomal protein N' [Clostridium oryzae]OPJ61754.1 primosomal protein N' [Clostridium oryzae]
MFNYAGIIVNNESIMVDKVFTYGIPEGLVNHVNIGSKVKVPFGKGNKKIDGYVIELYENASDNIQRLKYIDSIVSANILFGEKQVKLIKFMKERYLCSYLDCIRVMLPSGILKNMASKLEQRLYTAKAPEGNLYKKNYVNIYQAVKHNEGLYNKNRLSNEFGFSLSSINTLIKHQILIVKQQKIDRVSDKIYERYEARKLNNNQKIVYDSICNGREDKYLIHGITGSGKTEIYLQLVEKNLKENKDCIVLVPEISLTPQMLERFKGRFGNNISVFHSRMSEGERYDEWMRVKEGRTKLAIGARSAIFLPFNNLGLIILDEEHDGSYKSESNPKYDCREVAEFVAGNNQAKVVYGTATPSMETYYRAKKGEVRLLSINSRADNAKLPEVTVVDMRDELISNNRSIFSRELHEDIRNNIEQGNQIILFLNRRGFSPFVSCRSCGFVYRCRQCDISLTYHREDNMLHCHYCGYKERPKNTCPKCGSKYIKYFGIGTEKVEEAVKKYFPGVKTLRMDMDTTRGKDSYINIYEAFKKGEAQVLIGTQMVSKGLDFPNVTLVGILAADLTLNLPDYKSAERTFQLITQVSGRAGRSSKEGKVVVQTYSPEHYSIVSSAHSNYEEFYNEEIGIRKSMEYIPFNDIINVNLNSLNEKLLIDTIRKVYDDLQILFQHDKNVHILGPCPCSISKIKELYRWQIILKGKFDIDTKQRIKKVVYDNLKFVYNDIKLNLDVNPNTLI